MLRGGEPGAGRVGGAESLDFGAKAGVAVEEAAGYRCCGGDGDEADGVAVTVEASDCGLGSAPGVAGASLGGLGEGVDVAWHGLSASLSMTSSAVMTFSRLVATWRWLAARRVLPLRSARSIS